MSSIGGLRLQPLQLNLAPKLVNRSAEQHQLVGIRITVPIHGATFQHPLQLLIETFPIRCRDWVWLHRAKPTFWPSSFLRFALRLINPRPGFALEAFLQAWAMQQPILGVGVLQAAILDRPRYGRNTTIQDRGCLFLGD